MDNDKGCTAYTTTYLVRINIDNTVYITNDARCINIIS